jgi:hypothetical protein
VAASWSAEGDILDVSAANAEAPIIDMETATIAAFLVMFVMLFSSGVIALCHPIFTREAAGWMKYILSGQSDRIQFSEPLGFDASDQLIMGRRPAGDRIGKYSSACLQRRSQRS